MHEVSETVSDCSIKLYGVFAIAAAPGVVWPPGQPYPDERVQHTGRQHRGSLQGCSGLAVCSRRPQINPHGADTPDAPSRVCHVLWCHLTLATHLSSESLLSTYALQAAHCRPCVPSLQYCPEAICSRASAWLGLPARHDMRERGFSVAHSTIDTAGTGGCFHRPSDRSWSQGQHECPHPEAADPPGQQDDC